MTATTPTVIKQGNNARFICMAYEAATPLIGIDLEAASATIVAKLGNSIVSRDEDIDVPHTFGVVPAGTTGLPAGQPCVFLDLSRTVTAALDPRKTYTLDAAAQYPDGTTGIPLCEEAIQVAFSRAI